MLAKIKVGAEKVLGQTYCKKNSKQRWKKNIVSKKMFGIKTISGQTKFGQTKTFDFKIAPLVQIKKKIIVLKLHPDGWCLQAAQQTCFI